MTELTVYLTALVCEIKDQLDENNLIETQNLQEENSDGFAEEPRIASIAE